MFETHPNGRGREDTTKRCPKETGRLSSPCLPHRFREGSSSVPNGNQSGSHADSPPLRGESEKKIWAPERPNTLPVWKFRGTRARVSRPLPTRAARSGCGVARLGVGPGIREVTSLRGLRGHLRPRTRPFCAGSPQRPSAKLQLLTRDVAKLLKAFPSLLTFAIRPGRVSPRSQTPTGRGAWKAGDAETPRRLRGTDPHPFPAPPLRLDPRPSARTHSTAPVTRGAAHTALLVGCVLRSPNTRPRAKTPRKGKDQKSATLATTGV